MVQDTTKYIDGCLACVENNPNVKGPKGPMHHQPIGGPWTRLQVDFISPLPNTSRGQKYCQVEIDAFTKWVEAYPTRNNTVTTTARVLLEQTFSRFGLP